MKLFCFLYLLVTASLFATDLQSLWSQSLAASAGTSTQDWKNWIDEAEKEGVYTSQAYFNLAHAHWSKDEIAPSVFNLLISAQLRTNPIGVLNDLNLIGKIQRALLDSPSPIENLSLKSFFIFNEETTFLAKVSFAWIIILLIFFRFGFYPPRRIGFSLAFLAVVLAVGSFLIEATQKNIQLPVILSNQGGLIPVYPTSESRDEKPVMELPSGLLVTAESQNENWLKISKPTTGWIKKEMQLPFPLVTLNSSSKNEVYQSKGVDHLAQFSRSRSDYLKPNEKR